MLDVRCSKIKKSFPFLFLPRNLPPLVFANVIPLCFLVAFLLTENDLSKEKLYTQCATRFYDLIDGFSATRSTLRFTASCFFYFSLFRYMFRLPPAKYSLSLSLNLKFFSLLFYAVGIVVYEGRKLALIFKTNFFSRRVKFNPLLLYHSNKIDVKERFLRYWWKEFLNTTSEASRHDKVSFWKKKNEKRSDVNQRNK